MQIPTRVLREEVKSRDSLFNERTTRERDREERILKMATSLFAIFGMKAISFSSLAVALGMGAGTLRRHFVDLESLLGTILRNHLADIVKAIGNLPQDVENPRQAAREAYLKATRTGFGAPTEAHLLFIRDRNILPKDEFEPIKECHVQIGTMLAGDRWEEALVLLDAPIFDKARIEQILALPPPEICQPIPAPAAEPPRAKPQLKAKPAKLFPHDDIDDMTRISGVRFPAGLDGNGKLMGPTNPQGP